MYQDKFSGFKRMPKISKILNTKEFCFLCLQTPVKIKREIICVTDEEKIENEDGLELISLGNIVRPFHTNFEKCPTTEIQRENVKANLCKICQQLVTRYSSLINQLEKLYMEMDHYRERIELRISDSSKNPELVQQYSKRMTSDVETLSQLAFIDKLRKEICVNASQRFTSQPTIKLIRSQRIRPQNLSKEEAYEEDDMDFLPEVVPSPASSISLSLSPNRINNSKEINHSELLVGVNTAPRKISSLETIANAQPKDTKMDLKPEVDLNHADMLPASASSLVLCNERKVPLNRIKSMQKFTTRLKYKNSPQVMKARRYKCDICKATFLSWYNSATHKKLCQKRLEIQLAKEKDPAFKFKCEFCKARFKKNAQLSVHRQQVHLNIDRYPCDLCPKKFKKICNLKEHKNSVHFRKTFPCTYCNERINSRTSLRRHEKKCVLKTQLQIKIELVEK